MATSRRSPVPAPQNTISRRPFDATCRRLRCAMSRWTTSTPLESGRVYLTGAQAFVRLLMLQRQRDALAGLNTAGFVSGYRGSPLGALDQSLWKAQKFLERRAHPLPARAERGPRGDRDLGLAAGEPVPAARSTTACSRCGTARARASTAAATSSSTPTTRAPRSTAACWCSPATTTAPSRRRCPHQSDHMFSAALIPVLYPSSVQEILDLGLHGWAMSRYSGCWVGFKCVADTVESSSSVTVDPARTQIVVPDDFPMPPRRPVDPLARRLPRDRSADAELQDLRRAALLPRQQAQPRRHRFADGRGSASSPAARATSTCARRSTTSASPRPTPPRSASASTRSRCPGRSSPRASASSRRASRRSSSSRRSGRSSSTS